jgi:hypothetical protein
MLESLGDNAAFLLLLFVYHMARQGSPHTNWLARWDSL